ncbi:MAG: hypothetical protein KME49_20590 [Brasilonema octagenarum HA4186-MV1]|jgi:hypothetical protein|nr:hypothetical protein [Brasilonema octagenarum HA4186-MV1]
MSARNEFETTVELQELSDADLMAINGGAIGDDAGAILNTVGDAVKVLGSGLAKPVNNLVGGLGAATATVPIVGGITGPLLGTLATYPSA